jgi:Flp pilus assembly protein TadG
VITKQKKNKFELQIWKVRAEGRGMYLKAGTRRRGDDSMISPRFRARVGLLRSIGAPGRGAPEPLGGVERGASIVEFAMVLPLFIGLLMGFIDFGLNLNNISSVRQAVREGARDLAVGDPGDAICTLSATATPGATEAGTRKLLCGIKAAVPGSSIRVRLAYPGSYTVGDKGLICAQYQVASATGFYQSLLAKTVTKVQTQMRIERIEPNMGAFSEDAFVGQDWTWCA